jgi:hypothetical protein
MAAVDVRLKREEIPMAVRPSVRFEVFKRDLFTCQYCGRKTPDVVLEADHIVPRAEGGTDDIENLVTACFDCNRGKGARPLDSKAPVMDVAEQTELIKEREEQIRAYHAVLADRDARREGDFSEAWNYWFGVWGVVELDRWHTPGKAALTNYVEKLGIGEVKEAIDITSKKFPRHPTSNAVRYLFGILKRKQMRRDGLIVPCTICAKDVFLAPGDDPTLGWRHGDCGQDAADG